MWTDDTMSDRDVEVEMTVWNASHNGLTEFANSNVIAWSHYILDPSHDPHSPTPVDTQVGEETAQH